MKGSNSRFSHRPNRRYSNTAHVQGGMVTDADLTEAGQLHQQRDEAQALVTVGSGSPAAGGIVHVENDEATLCQGTLVAEGKQGALVAATGDPDLKGAALFAAQADLPEGPEWPNEDAFVYADVWERPVFALQDAGLADAGLHGAETSYRTRTMVQIKALPLRDGMTAEQALIDLHAGAGVFHRKGTAHVRITRDNTEVPVQDCDPCADQVSLVAEVPNALFRLEVMEVARDAKGVATSVRFAWSHENASAIESVDLLKDAATAQTLRSAFGRRGAVYQYFSDTTEAQIGRFGAGFAPKVSEFDDQLVHRAFPFVRRWDGTAVVNLAESTAPADLQLGSGALSATKTKATLKLDLFSLDIALKNKELLIGDHWLVELRRFAPEVERIRIVSPDGTADGLPHGVTHHFCPLFLSDGETGKIPSNALKRQVNFPALTNLQATDVAFDPECPAFYDQAETVAEALNALCDLDAGQVAFEPPKDCERFEGARTVEDALHRLCAVQDDTMLTTVLRTMMDWGVVCGLRFSLHDDQDTVISWTAGTILDRTGQISDIPAGSFDLAEVPRKNYQDALSKIMTKTGEICLSVSVNAIGDLSFHFTDKATAFGPNDPTFREAVNACLEGRKWVDFGGVVGKLNADELGVVKKMADVWANRKSFDGHVTMSREDEKIAKSFNKRLTADYLNKASKPRAQHIEALLETASAELNTETAGAFAPGIRRMQQQTAMFGIIAAAEEEDDNDCACRNALQSCPPDPGPNGHLVPVACFKMQKPSQDISPLTELCNFCCRKQAMSWRAFRYYNGSFVDEHLAGMKDKCCSSSAPEPGTKWDDWFEGWVGTVYPPQIPPPILPPPPPRPEPHPLWPPIKGPGVLQPRDPRWTTPLPPVFTPVPKVERLPVGKAHEILTGTGFEISETLNLDDGGDLLDRLKGLGADTGDVLGREAPQPGDKVALLTSQGRAVDYVVIQKGTPKLPFETEAEATAKVEKIIANMGLAQKGAASPRSKDAPRAAPASAVAAEADLSALTNKLGDLQIERAAVESELDALSELKAHLAQDVAGLKTDMAAMSDLNGKLAKDVAKSRKELTDIGTLKDASLRDISKAAAELKAVQSDHEKMIMGMRREQPIESVLSGNPAAVKALKSKGVVTVGDIEKTDTRKLSTMMNRTGVNGSTAKRMADGFIKRK